MFDVDWSDPSRESVGDRRARKHKHGKNTSKKPASSSQADGRAEDDEHDDRADAQSGNRTSGSVRSSVSSVEKQFAFFGGKRGKKSSSPSSHKATTQSVASSSLRSPTVEEQPRSEVASTSSPARQRPSTAGPDKSPSLPPKRFSISLASVFHDLDDAGRAPGGSLLGCDITNPQPGSTTQFQELADRVSVVCKTTVVSTRERTEHDSDFLVSHIHISAADNDRHRSSSPAQASVGPLPNQFNEVLRLPSLAASSAPQQPAQAAPQPRSQPPQQPASNDAAPLPTIHESSNGTATVVPSTSPKRKRPARPKLAAPAIPPATLRPTTNADAWKAPGDWATSPTESAIAGVGPEGASDTAVAEKLAALSLDLAHMERETERMLEASPLTILRHLEDDDGDGRAPGSASEEADVADDRDEAVRAANTALACRDREMEKQRWLLSALYNMETIWDINDKGSGPPAKPSVQKILALFESQGTASYLAVANANVPVCHLSPAPLADAQFPNVHPMLCPIVSPAALAFAAGTFSAVSCTALAALLPAPDVPRLLRRVARVLAPGGAAHLVLLDPAPPAAAAGPRLRRWLDDHLLVHLELQFRATRPSRAFPVWLREARLRARGSAVTRARFPAVVVAAAGAEGGADADADADANGGGARAVNRALRCAVGRRLWRQIWGPFVACSRWWWEVPEIVDECLEWQTHWEYSVIAACKASDSE